MCRCRRRAGSALARSPRANWKRLTLKLLKIRKIQRYFHNLGASPKVPKGSLESGLKAPEERLRMAQQQQPPQQPGTPPAPAQGQTNGPNMSQVVMQMMAQLTQGQAKLNQAMTKAMNQQLQINRNVERSVEFKDRSELKGIPKPDKFTGASGTWDSWWYKFKTWVESCHKNAVKIVAQVESQCDKEITESGLEVDYDEGAELVSAQARQALISLTEGEALEIVKNTSRGSHFGLEAMRRLLCKYDPQNPQANSVLLKKALHPSQCSLDKLREGLESWENLKRKYEDRRKKPP